MSRGYDLEIIQAETNDGEVYEGVDIEEHLHETDALFYAYHFPGGEVFYRWVYGPFEDVDSLLSVIEEEVEFYLNAAAA